jgi:hypothetical protein
MPAVIEVELFADGSLAVTDNGRGMPVDPHPKFPDKSALEVIMTTLHAGGKFDSKVYETSGGLHGVGVSVVNALSDLLEVEVARGQPLYRQSFSRGIPLGPLETVGEVAEPARHHACASIPTRRSSAKARISAGPAVPHGALEGLSVRRRRDPLALRARASAAGRRCRRRRQCSSSPAASRLSRPRAPRGQGPRRRADLLRQAHQAKAATARVEWAIAWLADRRGRLHPPPTATPSRRRKAAPMSRACASPCCAACGSCRAHRQQARRRSPPTT